MNWFKIVVSEEAVSNGAIGTIMQAFQRIMPVGDRAKACALFERNEEEGSTVFVSPDFAAIASQLLEQFSASECETPPPRSEDEEFGTSLLLASHEDYAWSLLRCNIP